VKVKCVSESGGGGGGGGRKLQSAAQADSKQASTF
jgi:hypothetical protein